MNLLHTLCKSITMTLDCFWFCALLKVLNARCIVFYPYYTLIFVQPSLAYHNACKVTLNTETENKSKVSKHLNLYSSDNLKWEVFILNIELE